ncbi:MAG: DUF3786 domain-containing protein [Methanobacteriota archaeon]|nr:MAG: DUF3786 domain-containing protein [Euryarchaeota archaeon]
MIVKPRSDRDSHQDALERAWGTVSALDFATLAKDLSTGGDGADGVVRLSLLGDPIVADVRAKTVKYDRPDGADVSRYLQVLVLHYLAGVGRSQLTERLISFREFEGGAMYYPAFKARAITPLVREFGYKPELLRRVATAMGGEPLSVGSVGFRFAFFEKLPVSVVLWLGDIEVSASANILFDASAARILSTEDVTVVGGVLSRTLIKNARK